MNENGKNKICCIGIGHRGTTAVDIMLENGIQNVEFWAMGTDDDFYTYTGSTDKNKIKLGDNQSFISFINSLIVKNKIKLGSNQSFISFINSRIVKNKIKLGGKQSFSNEEEAAKAAEEAKADIVKAIDKSDIVFVTAGLGGNTGMGAAFVVAKMAKESGALAIGIVSQPFGFDGEETKQKANQGIEKLKEAFDTLIVIPNDEIYEADQDFFRASDEAILKSIQCITDIIKIPGLINIELSDIKRVISDYSVIGMGSATGKQRASEAAEEAIDFISLQCDISKASGLIINVTGSSDMTLHEVTDCAKAFEDMLPDSTPVVLGSVIDDKLNDEIQVTAIVTGLTELPNKVIV